NLAAFLSTIVGVMTEYFHQGPTSLDAWREACSLLRLLGRYLERTVALSTSTVFDEAKFQAHLAHGADLLQTRLHDAPGEREIILLGRVLESIKHDFTSGFKLSNGLSMEVLWKALRPTPYRDEAVLRGA